MSKLHELSLQGITGEALDLRSQASAATLIVNVASRCGLTPQYKVLETLWRANRQRGLLILGAPCNQFGNQEPGSAQEIVEFCRREYAVSFPLTQKLDVNGPGRHPLYQWLAGPDSPFPGDIQWNFEKFVVDAGGTIVARFGPRTPPDAPEVMSVLGELLAMRSAP